MHDVVKELGFLTLGTRFKRIGESLQAQAQALLATNGMDMPAAHFPLLAALDRLGPLGVSELSQAVGVSQPVGSRSLLGLEANGLEAAVAQACKPLKGSLLDQLSALEAALEQTPLLQRAAVASLAPPTPFRRRSAR